MFYLVFLTSKFHVKSDMFLIANTLNVVHAINYLLLNTNKY